MDPGWGIYLLLLFLFLVFGMVSFLAGKERGKKAARQSKTQSEQSSPASVRSEGRRLGSPGRAAAGFASFLAALAFIGRLFQPQPWGAEQIGRLIMTLLVWPLVWLPTFVSLWIASLVLGKWWEMEPRSKWHEVAAAVIGLLLPLSCVVGGVIILTFTPVGGTAFIPILEDQADIFKSLAKTPVPTYTPIPADARPTWTPKPVARPAHIPIPQTIIHVVEAGETLALIAERYNTTVETLVALNNIENANKIKVGQKLVVSVPPNWTPPPTSTPHPRPTSTPMPTGTPMPGPMTDPTVTALWQQWEEWQRQHSATPP